MQSSGARPDIESFLCACLRGEAAEWPFARDAEAAARFLDAAGYHGVLALLHARIQRQPGIGQGWPSAVVQACREGALAEAMWELRHRALLTEVLARLAAAGTSPLLFKGTALAYTLYPEPVLRSRGDTDLIIRPGTQAQVAEILIELGFARDTGIAGETVAYEASFTRHEPGSGAHTLDLHWRLNNSELLAQVFSHDELLRDAQPVAALGPHALATGPVQALLIACLHRVVHKHHPYYFNGVAHYGGNRLIWLNDLHLLASAFTAAQWAALASLAEAKGLCAVCLEGLEQTRLCLHTAIPADMRAALARPGDRERLMHYFAASPLRQQWMDFLALPGFASRLRFMREILFPPAAYMREKYPQGGWLPWRYIERAAGGILKRLRKGPAP